jgi:hypothetical protein
VCRNTQKLLPCHVFSLAPKQTSTLCVCSFFFFFFFCFFFGVIFQVTNPPISHLPLFAPMSSSLPHPWCRALRRTALNNSCRRHWHLRYRRLTKRRTKTPKTRPVAHNLWARLRELWCSLQSKSKRIYMWVHSTLIPRFIFRTVKRKRQAGSNGSGAGAFMAKAVFVAALAAAAGFAYLRYVRK